MRALPSIFIFSYTLFACYCPGSEPVQVVGTNSRVSTTSYKVATTNTAFWQRTGHQLGGPVDELDIAFMNWTITSGGEQDNSNSMTIDYAWLERESTGQIVPLTFSGSRQLVMPDHSPEPYIMADPVNSSVWTGGPLARDEIIRLSVKGHVPSNGYIYQGTYATYRESKFIVYNPDNDPGTVDAGGAVPYISGQSQRLNGLAVMFAGRYSEPGHLSVIGLGDSILFGLGDWTNATPGFAGNGFLDRAAINADQEETFAIMNMGRSGETANTWLNSHSRRAALLPFGNVVVEEYGTNDIGSAGTGDADAIYPKLKSIWQIARDNGIQVVMRTRLMPRTKSSSYNWTSLADQTPNTGWGPGEERDQLNAYLDAALSEDEIDVLVDTLTAVSDATDDHYWFTNGSNDYFTSDGTHPSANGYKAAALAMRAALETITLNVDEFSYTGWSNAIDWGSADSAPDADPNLDGITNLMAYALDISPLERDIPSRLPFAGRDTVTPNGPWLTYTYRQRQDANDVQYAILTSTNLLPDSWSEATPDGISIIEEIIDTDPDGDGSSILKKIRVQLPVLSQVCFLKLNVIFNPE